MTSAAIDEDRALPSAGDCYRKGWSAFAAQLIPLLVIVSPVVVTQLMGHGMTNHRGLTWLLGVIFMAAVATPLQWGFFYVCLRAVRGQRIGLQDLLRPFENYPAAVVANVAVFVAVLLGLCCLVLPGVVIFARTRFVPYLVVEEGMSADEALRESFRLTAGYEWTALLICGLGWLLSGAGILFFGVGLIPALMLWDLANAALYHYAVVPSYEEFSAEAEGAA